MSCQFSPGNISSRLCFAEAACTGNDIDVLMISTSLLQKDLDWLETLNEYKSVLEATENLCAEYVEVDSEECLAAYGIKAENPGDWEEIQDVMGSLVEATQASYIMLLGGVAVIPRPFVDILCFPEDPIRVPSDGWYVDLDRDQIVDEGLSIGRLPDLGYRSSAVTAYLQTAAALHNDGGVSLDAEVWFAQDDYETPPYGVCDACTLEQQFYDLMSTSNYIFFAGHGTATGFYNNDSQPIFTVDYMNSINLQSQHPVIIGYYSCHTGVLERRTPTLSYAFLKAGAAAFLGRTTVQGVPNTVAEAFPADIEEGMPIGPALFGAMRDAALMQGCALKAAAGHLCLYGDPTLRRRQCNPGKNMDGDGISDCEDPCPSDPDNDLDGDGICGELDNCPDTPNPRQEDTNINGIGDACELFNNPQICIIEANVSPNPSGSYVGDTVRYNIAYEITGGIEGDEYKVIGMAKASYGKLCSKKQRRAIRRDVAGQGQHVLTFQETIPDCAVPLDFTGMKWIDVTWRIRLKTLDGTVLDRDVLFEDSVYTIQRW
ncbi:MAG: thrombospondin type 3 repeat-containing protein [Desulfobacterales bacterium]|nr:MAG: thrombospondin type 3 repeat-containing protein [Desulfobacterales bacterium]